MKNDFKVTYKQFLDEFLNWQETGITPKLASYDIKNYLTNRQKRLNKFGLKLVSKIDVDKEIMEFKSYPIFNSLFKHQESMYSSFIKYRIIYMKGNRKIYNKKENFIMYQTIIDKKDNNVDYESYYKCPNCGALEKIINLEKGCSYCGTKYYLNDLYPKVTHYYFVKQSVISGYNAMDIFKILFSISYVIILLLTWFSYEDYSLPSMIARFGVPVFGALFMAIGMYFIFGIICGIVLLGQIILQSIFCTKIDSKNVVYNKISKYDKTFDYEIFMSKLTFLVNSILLSDNLEDCPSYDGEELSRFTNLVDVKYSGGFRLNQVLNDNGILHLNIDIYAELFYFMNNKILRKHTKLNILMHHRIDGINSNNLKIEDVKCAGCGGSFNIRQTKYCPYCGTKIDMSEYDWVITSIK